MKRIRILIIIFVLAIIVLSIGITSAINKKQNFDKEMKTALNPISSGLDWIDSYKIVGKHKQQVTYYANAKIKDTNYNEITKLLKDTYNTLDREVTSVNGIGSKYDKDGYKSYKEITAILVYNDMQYYVDYNTDTYAGAKIKSDLSLLNQYASDNNDAFLSQNDFISSVLNKSNYGFNIANANFPQGDIAILNVSWDENFYESKISEQYIALRYLYEDYINFLNINGKSNVAHALWIFNQNCNNVIYKLTMVPYRDQNDWIESYCGEWFDDISQIPLYVFDSNPVQLNIYDNETLYSGYSDANVDWDYSSVVSMAEYQEQDIEINNTENIPDNAFKLYYEGEDILCGTTQENIKDAIDCIVNGDDYGFNELYLEGKIFEVPSNTYAILLDQKLTTAKVRICEGAYENQVAWVIIEAIQ